MKTHTVHTDALSKHLAVLGTTGSGKSYTARGLLERLIDHHIEIEAGLPRVCIVDPKGDWFGIRLDADGKRAAEDFIIIGGPRADAGLRIDDQVSGGVAESMAKPIASMVATSDARIIIDLSDLSASKMRRFTAAFLQALYTENRKPLHLIVDEADEFAPQSNKGDPAAALSLGAMERIAKRGRQRGFRLWMVTQRPASLHKDVLGMAQTVVAMKMGLPHDRKAVGEWIKGQVEAATEKEQKAVEQELVNSLPTLERGEGWVWEIGSRPQRMKFPKIRTFDSMKTPEAGDDFGTIDLPAIDTSTLGTTLAGLVEQQKADDPKELHKRIAELEAKLRGPQPREVTQRVQESHLADIRRLTQELQDCQERIEAAKLVGIGLGRLAERDAILASIEARKLDDPQPSGGNEGTKYSKKYSSDHSHSNGTAGTADVRGPTETTRTVRTNRVERPALSSTLEGPLQKIVNAIAWWDCFGIPEPSRPQVAAVAGYAVSGGSFQRYLSSLSSGGLVTKPSDGNLTLTEKGWEHALSDSAPVSEANLHARVMEILEGPHRKILDVLLKARGEAMGRTEVAERAGYEATGGSFQRYVSHLSGLKLIAYPKRTTIAAAAWLFPGGAR